jgi:prepilin signal peptidase PulO-like enzyme (type II secretory pathway)
MEMTYEEREVRQTSQDPTVVGTRDDVVGTRDETVTTRTPYAQNQVVSRSTAVSPSAGELGRRVILLIFGIIQILIILRIVLLLLNAREGNDLVAFILNTSQVFVSPFNGIFNRDELRASGSVLDIAAVAAFVGWTVLEWILLWAMNLFRRETVV